MLIIIRVVTSKESKRQNKQTKQYLTYWKQLPFSIHREEMKKKTNEKNVSKCLKQANWGNWGHIKPFQKGEFPNNKLIAKRHTRSDLHKELEFSFFLSHLTWIKARFINRQS